MGLVENYSTAIEQEEANNVLLILDDEKEVLNALSRVFRRTYNVQVANNTQEAFDILSKSNVQVILSDQRMPDMKGTEFFRKIKDTYKDTIRILITGYSALDDVILAINEGDVYRYLRKPWNLTELKTTVQQSFEKAVLIEENERMIKELKNLNKSLEEKVQQRTIEISSKNKELEKLNKELELLATRDSLTGMNNRLSLDSSIKERKQIASRLNLDLTLVMIDLNRFKTVNDRLGHEAGDVLLKKFATITKQNIRAGQDIAFRIGGDEFLIALLDCKEKEAYRVVNSIDSEFKKHTQISSLAYGIVEIDVNKETSVEEWLREADKRMYLNKNLNRGS